MKLDGSTGPWFQIAVGKPIGEEFAEDINASPTFDVGDSQKASICFYLIFTSGHLGHFRSLQNTHHTTGSMTGKKYHQDGTDDHY